MTRSLTPYPMRLPSLLRTVSFLAVAGVLLVGCRRTQLPPPPEPPAPLAVTVVGESDLNGGGNAAVVRIYQLAGDANFRRAPVQSFWQNDEQALGSELLSGKREVLLFPDVTETVEVPLDDRTQFVGFAADLRDPDPDHWRAIFPVSEVRERAVAVRVGERRLFVRVDAAP